MYLEESKLPEICERPKENVSESKQCTSMYGAGNGASKLVTYNKNKFS